MLTPDSTVTRLVFARLDALAAKLGVAIPQMWELLVRQVYVDALAWVLATAVFGVTFIVTLRIAMRHEESEGLTVLAVLFGIGTLISTLGMIVSLPQMLNPGYSALHEILSVLK